MYNDCGEYARSAFYIHSTLLVLSCRRFSAKTKTTFPKLSCISGSETDLSSSIKFPHMILGRCNEAEALACSFCFCWQAYTQKCFSFLSRSYFCECWEAECRAFVLSLATLVRALSPRAKSCSSFFLISAFQACTWKQQIQGQLLNFLAFRLQLRLVLHCYFNTLETLRLVIIL